MNRIDRLQAILIQLQSKRVVKAQEIANRFEISLRTVYRDISALLEAGVPIGAEAGVGYYLVEGYHLPPVMLTKAEAGALVLGAKMVEHFGDQKVDRQFDNALFKIKSVLKANDKEYLETLEQKIVFSVPKRSSAWSLLGLEQSSETDFYLTEIQTALANRLTLDLEYYASYRDQFSKRTVEPLALFFYSNSWHLIAWCQMRQAYRDFRTDRIRSCSVGNSFDLTRSGDSLRSYLEDITRNFQLSTVRVQVRKGALKYMETSKHFFGLSAQKTLKNCVLMDFRTGNVEGLKRWLLSYGAAVQIIEPSSLNYEMFQLARELADHYSQIQE